VEQLAQILPLLTIGLPVVFVGLGYFVLSIDRQRAGSLSKDDTQAGIKLVLWGFLVGGVMLASGGVTQLLAFVFGGFKGGGAAIKQALPPIIVGAGVVAGVSAALLPRTNNATQHQVERYALGLLAVSNGVVAIGAVNTVLTNLFNSAPWGATSGSVASAVVSGAIALLAVGRLGTHSGWTAPPPRPQAYPPQAPQGGGYPPQQGYGQQGGYQQPGYPPQGGGYPPQGGGYPPQGGGYPPQA
jgi:hypothetical protein